jgi:HD-GYP domain-containing protein (c-di-GMP phosphodiesterase class II)
MQDLTGAMYIPIPPLLLTHDAGREFQTYIRVGTTERYILYARNGALTPEHKETLHERDVEALYIRQEDKIKYDEYVQQNYGKILLDERISLDERSAIYYEQSTQIIKSLFTNKLPRAVLTGPFYDKLARIIEYNCFFIIENKDSFESIGKLIDHNYKTYSHSLNVSIYASCLLQHLGYDASFIRDVSMGAILHDLGKLFVPAELLDKPGKLTPEEFELVKTHSTRGVAAAQHLPINQTALNCILFHHEKLDGSGYPSGLQDQDIPTYCRIVTIADIYDAITSRRPYNDPSTPFEGLLLMMKDVEKNRLDKYIFKSFVELLSGANITV